MACECVCVCACVRVGRTVGQGGGAKRRDSRERKEKQKYDGEVTDWFGCTEAHGVRASFFFLILISHGRKGHRYDDVDDLVPDGAAS